MPYPDPRPHAETMLYRAPGPHLWEGMRHDFIVVPDADVDAKLVEGWFSTVHEAHDAYQAALAEKIAQNEQEQEKVAAQLGAVTDGGAGDPEPDAKLSAVHKGRGSWSLVDAGGKEVETGLTKEQAQAKASPAEGQALA